ncbi:MAG: 1-deoxy-D-xylulose-5-phosphate synthase [Planctomycetota bacterium]|nr:1-deoxy-D-xylulose-5-phosphate synthase [Planctomycetota bacterium]
MSSTKHSIPAGPEAPSVPNPAVGPLLEGITAPGDLDGLDGPELVQLCGEIRHFLLESVQQTGGHLGSNLGVVELSVALHKVFDFRRDRLVLDVSHQCYPHKILTGRRDGFANLRKTGGMCGFTHPDESDYDLFHFGHAGTSIATGLGLAMGTAGDTPRPHVVSLIGDASLASGVAFEALSAAGASGERMIVVLNDNEWSISRSVGALATYLTRLRSNRTLQRAQQEIQGLVQSIPLIGKKMDQLGEVLRHALVPGHVFEELGVSYVGPIKGHDVEDLVETLERVSQLDGVTLLHVLTEKGKGHPTAPTHPERHHAAKPPVYRVPSAEEAEAAKKPSGQTFTQAFAAALEDAAERDLRVHAITAGMPSGTGLVGYAERFPSRFHDTGIAEQHAVAMAGGMAKAGLRPVAAIYSTFLQRGYDQVFQEVALQGLPVLFCMDRAGLVGSDGPTHNGVFDLAYLRCLPGMVLGSPRDATDMRRMIDMYLRGDGPVGLRYPRGNCPAEERIPAGERRSMQPGKAEVLREQEGDHAVIWALGAITETALEAAAQLAVRGIRVAVVDARFAKPLDHELLLEHAKRYPLIVTIEEHQRAGGFGSAVLETLAREPGAKARVRCLAIPDRYVVHMSSRDEQLASVGLATSDLVRAVEQGLVGVKV